MVADSKFSSFMKFSKSEASSLGNPRETPPVSGKVTLLLREKKREGAVAGFVVSAEWAHSIEIPMSFAKPVLPVEFIAQDDVSFLSEARRCGLTRMSTGRSRAVQELRIPELRLESKAGKVSVILVEGIDADRQVILYRLLFHPETLAFGCKGGQEGFKRAQVAARSQHSEESQSSDAGLRSSTRLTSPNRACNDVGLSRDSNLGQTSDIKRLHLRTLGVNLPKATPSSEGPTMHRSLGI